MINAHKKLLIAEDEEQLRETLVEYFSTLGYEVSAVHDGNLAIELMEKQSFDAIITDIRMPTKTGIDLLNRVVRKKKKGGPNTKVIIMTGLLEEGEEYLLALGAAAVLEKPVRLQKVAEILMQVLK